MCYEWGVGLDRPIGPGGFGAAFMGAQRGQVLGAYGVGAAHRLDAWIMWGWPLGGIGALGMPGWSWPYPSEPPSLL